MCLCTRIGIEHRTVAPVDAGARLPLTIDGSGAAACGNREPVFPEPGVEVPPVPKVVAEVPPTAAEPPVPPVMLVCAQSGDDATSKNTAAEAAKFVFILLVLSLW